MYFFWLIPSPSFIQRPLLPLANFNYTALLTIVTMLYIRPSDSIHRVAGSLPSFTKLPLFNTQCTALLLGTQQWNCWLTGNMYIQLRLILSNNFLNWFHSFILPPLLCIFSFNTVINIFYLHFGVLGFKLMHSCLLLFLTLL